MKKTVYGFLCIVCAVMLGSVPAAAAESESHMDQKTEMPQETDPEAFVLQSEMSSETVLDDVQETQNSETESIESEKAELEESETTETAVSETGTAETVEESEEASDDLIFSNELQSVKAESNEDKDEYQLEIKTNSDKGTMLISLTGVPDSKAVQNVGFPTWTEENGQDDIIWHAAQKIDAGTWSQEVNIANYNYAQGMYNVHAYVYYTDGTYECVGTQKVDMHLKYNTQMKINVDSYQSKMTVILSGQFGSDTPSRIVFPVWTQSNGQDDIVWHIANKKNSSTYTAIIDIKNHHSETGSYIIHAYAYDKNNNPVFLNSGMCQIQPISAMTGIQLLDQDTSSGKFRAQVVGVKSPAQITSVKFMVWTDSKGQDDVKWYEGVHSGNVWYADVSAKNHNYESGKYHIYCYAADSRGVSQLMSVAQKTLKVTVKEQLSVKVNKAQSQITITLSGAAYGKDITNVAFPVWTENRGQDDIVWHIAKKKSNSVYEAVVNIKNHHCETGTYNIHAYKYKGNTPEFIDAKVCSIEGIKAATGIQLIDQDTARGNFRTQMINIVSPASVTSVKFAVWTDKNGQDDIRWYSGKHSGNVWYADVKAKEHSYESGTYHIECYAYDSRGVSQNMGSVTKKIKVTKKDRVYQNPSQYYQIKSSITLSGGGYNLSVGYEGLKVAYVKRALGLGNAIGLNGALYTQSTANYVKTFQRKHGLSQTGIVNLATWKAMGYSESDWYGLGAYVSPIRVDETSTRSEHIEAMIDRAYDYLGTSYIIGASGAPGTGVDCSGMVMQALYAAGLDISPINPVRHSYPGYEYESANMWASSKFKHVSYSQRKRGDLIFYQNSRGAVIHVAIYLGNNQVIESTCAPFNRGVVQPIQNAYRSNIKGVVRPFV